MQVDVFLSCLEQELDTVVKGSRYLPELSTNHDIDIFTVDADRLISCMVETGRQRGISETKIVQKSPSHWHLDILFETEFFRFDIFSSFPRFSRFTVREGVFDRIIATSELRTSGETCWPEPNKLFGAFVRYIEYLEFFWSGPEKTHHLDWILEELSIEERSRLFTFSHQFLEIKAPSEGALNRNFSRPNPITSTVFFVLDRLPGLSKLLRSIRRRSTILDNIARRFGF